MSQYTGTRTNKGEAPPHVTHFRPPTPRSMRPNQDREYAAQQAAQGIDVVVNGVPSAKTMPQDPDENVEFNVGERVQYRPIGGPDSKTSTSTGTVERVLTSKTAAGSTGVSVNASIAEPQYEIKNDNTKKTSALKGKNILGRVESPHEEGRVVES